MRMRKKKMGKNMNIIRNRKVMLTHNEIDDQSERERQKKTLIRWGGRMFFVINVQQIILF